MSAIVVVKIIALIGEHELDLAAFRKLGGLVKHEPPSSDLRLERQRHGRERSMSCSSAAHAERSTDPSSGTIASARAASQIVVDRARSGRDGPAA
jgi:hypothetical protein